MLIVALLIQNAGDRRLGPHDGAVFFDVLLLNRPVGQGSRDQPRHERLAHREIVGKQCNQERVIGDAD